MTKVEAYLKKLSELSNWDKYLMAESRLPGPRANLELMEAFSRTADEIIVLRFAHMDEDVAPENTPEGFLAVCGTRALAKLILGGKHAHRVLLCSRASDPRWRVREGVAMALQEIGREEPSLYLDLVDELAQGGPLEMRAAVAALAEPDLLRDVAVFERALQVLEVATRRIEGARGERGEPFRVLRKTLGYAWSVVVVADPEGGIAAIEPWFTNENQDIRWIMRQNLRKKRLERMDPEWTARWKEALQLG